MFWNRKKKPPASRSEPRDHHYVFAHLALREICMQDAAEIFRILASPERDKFLAWLWGSVEKRVGRRIDDLDPRDLAVTTLRVADSPAIIIRMPVPVAPAEAHLIGAVLAKPAGGSPATARYFTLEHGLDLDGSARTVLCEWADGSHRNYGDGPPPTVQDFARALEQSIRPAA